MNEMGGEGWTIDDIRFKCDVNHPMHDDKSHKLITNYNRAHILSVFTQSRTQKRAIHAITHTHEGPHRMFNKIVGTNTDEYCLHRYHRQLSVTRIMLCEWAAFPNVDWEEEQHSDSSCWNKEKIIHSIRCFIARSEVISSHDVYTLAQQYQYSVR